MIINMERNPEFSLYYIGSVILEVLQKKSIMQINELLLKVQGKFSNKIHIDFIYYALDWLFLLNSIKIIEGIVYYDNKEINCSKN